MVNNTEEGDVAEIYVEGHAVDDEEEEDDEDNNFEDEIEGEQEEHDDSEFEGGYEELTDLGEDVLVTHNNKNKSREDVEKQIKFVREDDNSSEEDEEVVQIQKKFKEIKKSMKSGQVVNLDDVILDRPNSGPTMFELDDDANGTPYANSCAEDESEEEASEGHLETKHNYYPRFSKNYWGPNTRACIKMVNNTEEGDVAEIYVEGHAVDDEEEEDDEDNNFEDEIEGEQKEHDDSEFEGGYEELTDPGEDVLIQKKFKEIKKSMKSGQVVNLDDVILDRPNSGPTMFELDDDANGTPYANSCAEDESEEEASEGHLETKHNYYPRFSKNYWGPNTEACIKMVNNTEEGDVAEIYVEGHAVDDEEEEDDEDNNFEDEIEGEQEEHDDSEFEGGYEELTDPGEDVLVTHNNKNKSREDVEKQIKLVREWYNPSKMDKGKQVVDDQGSQPVDSQQNISSVLNDKENLEDSSDSEFLSGDDNSSEEDEEVVQIQKKFKEIKKSMKSGQVANLDDVILDRPNSGPTTFELDDDANGTPYANSCVEDESEEEASEGHLETKHNYYPRQVPGAAPLPFVPGSDHSVVAWSTQLGPSCVVRPGDCVCSFADLGSFADFIVAEEKQL
ncbi:protein bfr2-like [Miscanthus floridulus]|uniref:protein bfr2-like n=1 Tax=Miscanthus floridulus TaxID=154761 RepID=UPI00345B3E1C